MAGPSLSYGTAGNLINAPTLASGTPQSANVDFSSGGAFGGDVAVEVSTGSTVTAGANGCRVDIFAARDVTPNFDTVAAYSYTFSGLAASSTYGKTLRVSTGVYRVTATNLDTGYTIAAKVTSSKLS